MVYKPQFSVDHLTLLEGAEVRVAGHCCMAKHLVAYVASDLTLIECS
jgi:hypothetical protein